MPAQSAGQALRRYYPSSANINSHLRLGRPADKAARPIPGYWRWRSHARSLSSAMPTDFLTGSANGSADPVEVFEGELVEVFVGHAAGAEGVSVDGVSGQVVPGFAGSQGRFGELAGAGGGEGVLDVGVGAE